MKAILTFLLALTISYSLAQNQIGIGIGGNVYQIDYTDADGKKNNSLSGLPGAMAFVTYSRLVGSGQSKKATVPHHTLSVELGYKAGSIIDVSSQVNSSWQLNYLTNSFQFRHITASKNKISYYYGGGPGVDVLVAGSQRRGFEQYDLRKELVGFNLVAIVSGGLNYSISEHSHGTLGLAYQRGFTNLERDKTQKALLHGWKLSLAIVFK